MEEKKDKNSINDDLINNKANNKNDYKTFNILKDIQNLLKKESNCKDICKIKFFMLLLL